jgi:hypothetical protein
MPARHARAGHRSRRLPHRLLRRRPLGPRAPHGRLGGAGLLGAPGLLVLAGAACPGPAPAVECERPSDCEEPAERPCARCPLLATSLCLEGACLARPPDAVDVSATLVLDRTITAATRGLVWAIVSADRSCAELGSFEAFAAELNGLAAGQKTLSGGGLHPDVPLARAPEGALLIVALATDEAAGQGRVLGSGCAEATATAPSLAVERLDLGP